MSDGIARRDFGASAYRLLTAPLDLRWVARDLRAADYAEDADEAERLEAELDTFINRLKALDREGVQPPNESAR